jgi:integrase
MKRLRLVDSNPWKNVDLPKLDAQPIRTLTEQQVNDFFDWLQARWHGWELPTLFFELKAITACRLQDIASLKTSDLTIDGKNHRVQFSGDTTKARKTRVAIIPEDLFEKLQAIAGEIWLWENYSKLIGSYLTLRGVPTHRVIAEFDPSRLVWWAMDEVDDFNKSRPDQPKIRSHDFCKRAITEAHKAGMDVDTVASGVGRNPNTVRSYYLALSQQTASASMTEKLAATLRPKKANA